MKIMHIGNELICIVCGHIECAFSQSTSISGLKSVWRWIALSSKIMQMLYFAYEWLHEEANDKGGNNKYNFVTSLR